jgi:hypothetical protein
MKWRVARQRFLTEPPQGWNVERAFTLELARRLDEKRPLVVGYEVGAPTTSARLVVRPFLADEEPPRRVHVRRDGKITPVD